MSRPTISAQGYIGREGRWPKNAGSIGIPCIWIPMVGRRDFEELGVRGDEFHVASAQHSSGKATHDGLGLHEQVAEHGARLPSADKANAIAVDSRTQERHRACVAE